MLLAPLTVTEPCASRSDTHEGAPPASPEQECHQHGPAPTTAPRPPPRRAGRFTLATRLKTTAGRIRCGLALLQSAHALLSPRPTVATSPWRGPPLFPSRPAELWLPVPSPAVLRALVCCGSLPWAGQRGPPALGSALGCASVCESAAVPGVLVLTSCLSLQGSQFPLKSEHRVKLAKVKIISPSICLLIIGLETSTS